MKRIKWPFITALILLPVLVDAQSKLVEKVAKTDKEVIIPYEKYILSNGLTLIVHEDHSDPVVQVDVTYHVGSAREEISKSGFAHFFEHMMFRGTDKYPNEKYSEVLKSTGASANANTSLDRTLYHMTGSADKLDLMFELEADLFLSRAEIDTQQREKERHRRGADDGPQQFVFARTLRFFGVSRRAHKPASTAGEWNAIIGKMRRLFMESACLFFAARALAARMSPKRIAPIHFHPPRSPERTFTF